MKPLSGKTTAETSTVISLYEEVAKTKLTLDIFDLGDTELCLKTLHLEYKGNFLDDEWKRKCLFEYHFQKNTTEILSCGKMEVFKETSRNS